ncbi:MAG TPA: hypothetical protein PLZ10_09210, partial [Chitinophagaceae bacterium]|nr:hypothetical protein [Chitinophagaceae bacterium]
MKRLLFVLLTFFILSATADAAHIKGGFFTYRYLGPGNGSNLRYQIKLTVYMICTASEGQVNTTVNFSIFNAGTNQFLQNASVALTNSYTLNKSYNEPCITGDERGCYYLIVEYNLPSIELPSTPNGYIVAYQRCCRISGINNLVNSGAVGNTFSIKIPGTAAAPGAERNNSPTFLVNDTAVICNNNFFQFSFQATDPDAGDSLSYSFCDAYAGGSQNDPAPPTSTNPPFSTVPYASSYSGSQPLGPGVTINSRTGIISGIAPGTLGQYVICVCVNEYKGGVLISTVRKELHVTVFDCDPLNAELDPQMVTCDG